MHFAFKKHPQTPQITRFHKESHLVVIFRNAKTCRPSLHGFQNHPKSNKLDPFPSPLGDEVLKPRRSCKSSERNKGLFPSPLGDEVLKPIMLSAAISVGSQLLFPSPLGDEVLKPSKNCRWTSYLFKVPSPLGDEVLKPRKHHKE